MSEMVDLKMIRQDGRALAFIVNQTPKIVLAAVNQNGHALQFVKKQTPEVVLAAVKQRRDAIKFVKPELKFLFRKEFEGLSLEEIKAKVPELFPK